MTQKMQQQPQQYTPEFLQDFFNKTKEKECPFMRVIYTDASIKEMDRWATNSNAMTLDKSISGKETPVPPYTMVVPRPVTLTCLFIALHELHHAIARDGRIEKTEAGIEHVLQIEEKASRWAKNYMESYGMQVPEHIWQDAQRNWAAYKDQLILRLLEGSL